MKTCLIGLGAITKKYIKGLENASFLTLCAVSDLDEHATGRPFYRQYPFYVDYQQMLAEQRPAYVIISTPPATHYEIATYCLQHGINVLVEKPAALRMEHLDALTQLAAANKLVFQTLFHWQGGIETVAFNQQYNLAGIEQIRVQVLDAYCDDGKTINPNRRPLMGAWVDSGVNALSMIGQWLPFEHVEVLQTESARCSATNLPIYAKVNLCIDGIPTEIVVDWRQGEERKDSFVKIEDRWVHVNHAAQSIEDGTVTEYARMPRLEEHYRYLFEHLDDQSNGDFVRLVHEVLFRVEAML